MRNAFIFVLSVFFMSKLIISCLAQDNDVCLSEKLSLTCHCGDASITCVGAQASFTEVSLRDKIFASGWLEQYGTLATLKISVSNLEPIPDFAFSRLPNLHHLALTKAKYVNLSDNVFFGLNTTLADLSLKHNNFNFVPKSALQNLEQLEKLDLSSNFILMIAADDFTHHPKLIHLDLSNNKIKSIAPNSFSSQFELATLMLQDNELEVIDSNSFRGLSNLRTLFLASNHLLSLSITQDNDYLLSSLENLYLGHNAFQSLENVHLDLSTLKILCLKNNSLSGEVKDDAFAMLPKLRVLILGYNSLFRISPDSFSRLPDLNRLDLSYNSLKILPNGSFAGNPKLDELNLQKNDLHSISPWAFRNLSKLSILNLATNFLNKLECSHTSDLHSLAELNLNFNFFATLSPAPFSFTPNLAFLHLKGNPFDCECPLADFIDFLNASVLPRKYKNLALCSHPEHLKDKKLIEVHLNCPSNSIPTCDPLTLETLASQIKIIFSKMLWDGYLFQLSYYVEGLSSSFVPHFCYLIQSSTNQSAIYKISVSCPQSFPQTFKYASPEITYDNICLEIKFQNGITITNCSSITLDESQRIGGQGGTNVVYNVLNEVLKPKVGFLTPNISISLQKYDDDTTVIQWTILDLEWLSESCTLKVALSLTDNKNEEKHYACSNNTLFINEILLAKLRQICIVMSYKLLDKHMTECIPVVPSDFQDKEPTFDIPYYPIGAVSLVFLIALIIMIILLIQRTCQKHHASRKAYKVHFEKDIYPNNIKKALEEEEEAAFLDGPLRPPQGKLYTFSTK